MSDRVIAQALAPDPLSRAEPLGGGMGMLCFLMIFSALIGGIGYAAWRQINRRWLRWALLTIAAGTVAADYGRCALNPKLRASGQFYGDMIAVGAAVLVAAIIWCAVNLTRSTPPKS